MIKKLFIIGTLTGTGHFVTLLSLQFLSKKVNDNIIASIGEIDSLSLLIISIIAFGLQLSTTRELALLNNWKNEYYTTQSARFTLSLFLLVFSVFGFFYTKNYLFLIAPIVALNADYALYGRGKPIIASIIALIRTLIPALTLVFCSIYTVNNLIIYYSISIVFAYLLTGILVAIALKVQFFIMPNLKHLKKYLHHFRIGIASFAFFFIGIGIINILSYFYNEKSIAVTYLALKLYMIFKGIRRIIVQSFFKELTDISIAIKIDYFAIIVGVIFLVSLTLYQELIISLLFDVKYITYTNTFFILGFAGFFSSITTSSGTRLLLKKQDTEYSNNLIIAAITTIFLSLAFYFLFGNTPYFIAIAILFGEVLLSTLNILSLNEKAYIKNRVKVIYPVLLISLLFIPVKTYFAENIITFIIALFVFGLIVVFYTKKKLNFV